MDFFLFSYAYGKRTARIDGKNRVSVQAARVRVSLIGDLWWFRGSV